MVQLHGRNPLFVPCSAVVVPDAALAVVEAVAVGGRFSRAAPREFATARVVLRPNTERLENLLTQCTFMCDVPFHLELSVRAYDCELCWIVPGPATVDRRDFGNGFKEQEGVG